MLLQSKYIEDENGVKFAPISTPNAIRWPDGSNLNDKLVAFDKVLIIETITNATTLTCEADKYYKIKNAVETLSITLPAVVDITAVKNIIIYLTAGNTPAITINSADATSDIYYQDNFKIEAGKTYEINCLYNGTAWIIAGVEIVVPVVEEEEGGE